MGFHPIQTNSYIFIRDNKDGIVIIGLYVDDILIATKDPVVIKAIKAGIYNAFKCTEAGPINRILGI